MAEKGVAIRLSLEDAAVVRRALEQLGETGEKALKRIQEAGTRAGPGLQALGAVAGDLRGKLEGAASSLGPAAAGLSRLGVAGLATGAALGGMVTLFKAGITAAEESARSFARLEAVLKATGNAIGVSGKQIAEVAEEIEKTTLASAEAAIDAAGALATFGTVAGQNFGRTLRAAQDLAAVFGGDIRGAALSLGKALDDPIRALDSLRKQGIAFSQAEREQVAALQRAGREFEAQALILDKVEKRVGGAAAAERTGVSGAVKGLTDAWSDLLKELGRTPSVVKPIEFVLGMVESGLRRAIPPTTGESIEAERERLSRTASRYIRKDAASRIAEIDAQQGDIGQNARRREQIAAFAGDRAAAERAADDVAGLNKAVDDLLLKQKEELKLAALVGDERERQTAALKATEAVLKEAGFKNLAEAEKAAAEGSDKAKRTLELARQSAGIAEEIVDKARRAALNAKATEQSFQEAARLAAQSDQDRRDAQQRGKDLETAAFGIVGNQEKVIKQLEAEAEATKQATVEYDALTNTYRVVNRNLLVLQESAKIKNSPEGSLIDPKTVQDLAERTADWRLATERMGEQQQRVVEQLNKQNELMLEPFKNAIQGIQGAFSTMFEDIFTGTTDLFGSLKKVAIRFAAEIATLLVFRPAVGGLLDMFGLGGLAQQMGLGGAGVLGAGALGLGAVSPDFIGPLQAGQSYAGGGLSSLLGLTGQGGFLGGGLQTIIGGAGLGFAAPQILRQLGIGIGKGSPVGSGIGSIGGALAGNFLLPGIGGFVGGALGGFLGDIVGGLFGGGGGMSQEEYYQNVNYYNDQYQKTQARAAFNPTIAQYGARASASGSESQYKQALKQAEQDYQQLTAKMTELGYDASNFANVAQVYGQIVAKIGTEFREGMDRELDLALGQATGNMTAAFDDLVRTQGERRDEVKEVGADIVKAEQVFAAERLAFLQQLTQAQRDMIRATLGEADLALADLADKGMTAGDRLIAAGEAMAILGDNIEDFLKGLSLSDLSPLSAGAKYGQARETFEKTIAAARGGDAEAIARVQSDLQVFLTASRGMFASGDQYSQDYAMATGLAAALGADAPGLASGLGKAGIGLNAALLKAMGVMGDGKVTGAEATPLLAELAALREELVGLTGPASDAVKQVEDLSQQIEAMRSATAQLPSYGPGNVVPLAANQNSASALPGWQQGAASGGPSAEFKNALVSQLYPGLSYDQAPMAARGAVDQIFQGDPWTYMQMGGQQATDTLINSNLYSAHQLEDRFNGTQYFGSKTSQAAYLTEAIFGGDQGGIGGMNGSVNGEFNDTNADGTMSMAQTEALGRALVNEALMDTLGKMQLNFNPMALSAVAESLKGQITSQIQATLPADVVSMASRLKDLITQSLMNQQKPDIQTLSVLKNTIDKIVEEALGRMAGMGMGDGGAGTSPGSNGTTNPSSSNIGVQMGIATSVPGISYMGMETLSAYGFQTFQEFQQYQDYMATVHANDPANTGNYGGGITGPNSHNDDTGGVGYATGGWVRGGIPGRDSVRSWLMPDEFVVKASSARRNAALLEGINKDPEFLSRMPSQGGDLTMLAELRGLRHEVAMLRAERREADNDAGQQRGAIASAMRGRAAARR